MRREIGPPIGPGESKTFTVFGEPKPSGSKRVFKGKAGKTIVAPDNPGTKPWMGDVALTAIHEWGPRDLCAIDGPVFMHVRYYFPRPDSHYGSGRNAGRLKDSAPLYPERGGSDTDKLNRAVKDALAGIVFTNDRRAVRLTGERLYGAPARCEITVSRPSWATVGEQRAAEGLVEPPPARVAPGQLELAS